MALGLQISGFEIRDMIAWVYGSGYPKHRSSLKPALEPITMARKPAERATLLNIDACRVEAWDGTSTARKPSMVNDTAAVSQRHANGRKLLRETQRKCRF